MKIEQPRAKTFPARGFVAEPNGGVCLDSPGESVAVSEKAISFRLPSDLNRPAFLLNIPFSYSTEIPNNLFMEELSEDERAVDLDRALDEFNELYHFMAAHSIVCLLPTPKSSGLQDLVFTANLGLVLTHLPDRHPVIISNFSSPPRVGEAPVGERYFKAMGYEVHISPHPFEGEADLKHLYDNVYLGMHGERSSKDAFDWMEETFDMRIITAKQPSPYAYHMDCSVFPITSEKCLVATSMYTPEEVARFEEVTEVIDIDFDSVMRGACNCVRLGDFVLNASNLKLLKESDPNYASEKTKNEKLEKIFSESGLRPQYFVLNEFFKGGAALSCVVMHLNRRSYEQKV